MGGTKHNRASISWAVTLLMFEKSQFLEMDAAERQSRLQRLRSELTNPTTLELLREAAHAFARLENRHHDEIEKGLAQLNSFADELKISTKKIDLNTFRRFLSGATKEPRAIDLAAVALFALHVGSTHAEDKRISPLIFGSGDERRKLFLAISDLMGSGDASAFISGEFSGNPTEPQEPKSIDLSGALPALIEVLTAQTPNESDVWERFCGGRPKGKQPKVMYFLTYRYSTTGGKILKGFLVVKQHPVTGFGRFRFSHFIWGGPENVNIFRETHGLMLGCEKAYYFLGFGVSVSGDKRDPAFRRSREYRELRAEPQVQTFELATIEYDEFELKEVVLSGLTMGSAARHQPVVSRLALLYLGTDRELSHELLDNEVIPTELPFETLEQDLLTTLRRLTESGVAGFDRRLGFKKSGKHFDLPAITKYVKRIETIIDNTAHWEAKANPEAKNAGAIESEGDGRPRA